MEDSEEEIYETELATLFSEEDEVHGFFGRLDQELNKVNQFYRKQESEFLERGDMLTKQLHILLDLKQIVTHRRRKNHPSPRSSNAGSFHRSPDQSSNYSG